LIDLFFIFFQFHLKHFSSCARLNWQLSCQLFWHCKSSSVSYRIVSYRRIHNQFFGCSDLLWLVLLL